MTSGVDGVMMGAAVSTFGDCTKIMHRARPYMLETPFGRVSVFLSHCAFPFHWKFETFVKPHSGCKECIHRFRMMYHLSGRMGPILFPQDQIDSVSDPKLHDTVRILGDVCTATCNVDPVNMLIVRNEYVHDFTPNKGPAAHWYASIPVDEQTTAPSGYVDILQIAFDRHQNDLRLFLIMMHRCRPESLEMLRHIVMDIPHGDKWIPTIDWMCDILHVLRKSDMSPSQAYIFSIQQMINAGIDNEQAICYNLLTAMKKIRPIIQNALDEEDMRIMCLDRLHPRRHLIKVQKCLGKFSNTVLSMARLRTLVPETLYQDFTCGIKRDSPKLPKLRAEIRKINYMFQFVNFISKHPEIPVFIEDDCTKYHKFGYLAETTLDPVYLVPGARRHLWSFESESLHDRMLQFYAPPDPSVPAGYIRIVATVPIYKYATEKCMLLVLPNGKIMRETNCCDSSFLAMNERQKCGSEFDTLNSMVPLKIPPGQIVAGIALVDTPTHRLEPLKFSIAGVFITVTRF